MNTKFGEKFEEVNTKFAQLETKIESVKSDFKLTKWQVHLIFGGITIVLVWLVKDYAESNLSLKGQPKNDLDVVRRVVSQPDADHGKKPMSKNSL
ncbi:hypothetical protein BGX38DRAFT_1183743 [Terfezia claveryi]|nr:hypothetical protein BGX38DRAFT_1183743 [Terfezia claveryi]